jgi:hypothetical protein
MKLLRNLFIISILFIFLNCSNEKINDPMSIEIGDKKVELKLENKKDYLVYDEPVKGEFVFTNIDIKKGWTIMGRGIKIINSKKSSVITEINYYSQKSESDTLTIVVDFDGSDEIDKKFKTIKVPVKRN